MPALEHAWAGIADTYYQLSSTYLPPHQAIPEARTAAATALEIDGTLAEAHASLGMIQAQYDWNRRGAELELTRAIPLNPNYARAHQWLGMFYYSDGRFIEALASLERAVELDPLSFYIGLTAVWPLRNLGRHDEAIRRMEQIAEMHPTADVLAFLPELRGEALLRKGISDAAIAELLQGSTATFVCEGSQAAQAALGAAYARSGMHVMASIARRMASGVAGADGGGWRRCLPTAETASRMARNTEKGSSSGGSPTA